MLSQKAIIIIILTIVFLLIFNKPKESFNITGEYPYPYQFDGMAIRDNIVDSYLDNDCFNDPYDLGYKRNYNPQVAYVPRTSFYTTLTSANTNSNRGQLANRFRYI
jgi:hypothetical protein